MSRVPAGPGPNLEPSSREDIRRGAIRGLVLLLGRSFGLLLLTAGATIALAHILSPSDYGTFAIAVAVQLLGKSVVEIGLPIALIRREEPPSLEEQRAVTGFMLAVGSLVATLIALIAFVLLPAAGVGSETMRVVSVACLALPMYGLRAVPVILVERGLRFGRFALFEASEVIVFYLFALPAAIAGFGAYSLAAAVPISAIAGVLTAFALQPWRFGLILRLDKIRPLARFGAQVSAMTPAFFARELGIVALLATVGGQALAGFYSLAQRLFSVPVLLAGNVNRVATAALARSESGERSRLTGRAIGVTSVAAGLPLALAAGASDPLIAVLFGERWLPAADVVASGAGGLMLSTAASLLVGLLIADGDARRPLVAVIAGAVTVIALTVPLGEWLGAAGGGLASSIGFTVSTALLFVAAGPQLRPSIAMTLRALAATAVGAVAGRLATDGTDAGALVLALGVAGVSWLTVTLLLSRREASDLVRLLREYGFPRREPARRGEEPLADAIAEADSAGV